MEEAIARKNEIRQREFKDLEKKLEHLKQKDVDKIVNNTSENIVNQLKNGQLSAIQVLQAFQYKVCLYLFNYAWQCTQTVSVHRHYKSIKISTAWFNSYPRQR